MKEVISYLENKLKCNDKIVIGLSGGPDSICLLSLLLQFKERLNLTIICAHVNHSIRKESEEEAEFVENLVREKECIFEYLKIEFYEKANFESNARNKRYDFYNQLVKKYQANYLMTAHHGDDLLETIMMRLVRGSNLKGYAGFKQETAFSNYQLIRPLIFVTKKEVEEYVKEKKLDYRIDKSNFNEKYTRNRYRHQIIPSIKKENENVHKKFLKFSEEIYNIETFLEKETEKALDKVYIANKLYLPLFNDLDLVLQKRVIEYILKDEYQNDINNITVCHLNKILEIAKSKRSNLYLTLPKKRKLIKGYDYLYFEKETILLKEKQILEDYMGLDQTKKIIKVTTCDIKKSNYVLRLDSKEVEFPLYIRNRNNSDTIEIKNLNGRKKLKDIFINEKIPLDKRDTWPILVDNKGTILWIPGLKKSKFDKNIDENYDIIYKYVISEEK